MVKNKNFIIRICFFIVSSALLIFCSVRTLQQKEALFLDEYSSYSCSNSADGKPIPYEKNKVYSPEEFSQLALEHYSVNEDERFRFDIVWNNLSINVHPPIFYVALHIICSLTPGQFSIWQAGVVNIIFAICSLFFFHQLTRSITNSEWLGGIMCLLWSINMGLTATTVLLRDYTAAMCGCTMTCWEVYRLWKGNRKVLVYYNFSDKRRRDGDLPSEDLRKLRCIGKTAVHPKASDFVKLCLSFAFSVLCHYYSAIYLFFLCALLCILLMIRKEWKEVLKIIFTACVAAGISILIFPSLLTRLSSSNRGTQATENLLNSNLSSYFQHIRNFYNGLNANVFAGRISYLVLIGLILLLLTLVLRKKIHLNTGSRILKIPFSDICLLVIPSICFFLAIAKLAPSQTSRYMFHIYAIAYLAVFASLLYVIQYLPFQKLLIGGISLLMCFASLLSWNTGTFNFLYINSTKKIENTLSVCQGAEAIQVSKNSNLVCVTLPEYSYFNSITFYDNKKKSKDNLLNHFALKEGKDVVLLLNANDGSKQNLDLIQTAYPDYQVDELGYVIDQNRFLQYYLHR